MSVLQSVWLEVLVLGVAYRSLGCEDEVVFAEDFVLDEEMSRVAGLTELNAAISQLARRFRALQLDREEFVMLKAIALTNSGNHTPPPHAVSVRILLSAVNMVSAAKQCGTEGVLGLHIFRQISTPLAAGLVTPVITVNTRFTLIVCVAPTHSIWYANTQAFSDCPVNRS